jgi:hypothetical protein
MNNDKEELQFYKEELQFYKKELQFYKEWNNRYMEMIRLIPIVLNMYNKIDMGKKKEILLNKWVKIPDEPYEYSLSDKDEWKIIFKQTRVTDTLPDLFMIYKNGYVLVDNIDNPNGGGGRQKKSSKKKFRNIKKSRKYRR